MAGLLGFSARVAPGLAGRVAERLFFTPRAAGTPGEVPSVSERVPALCDEIGGQALALAEARAAAGHGTFIQGRARPGGTSSGPGASSEERDEL